MLKKAKKFADAITSEVLVSTSFSVLEAEELSSRECEHVSQELRSN